MCTPQFTNTISTIFSPSISYFFIPLFYFTNCTLKLMPFNKLSIFLGQREYNFLKTSAENETEGVLVLK